VHALFGLSKNHALIKVLRRSSAVPQSG
jgi:hypothetical protein